jgi:hypothetical protein
MVIRPELLLHPLIPPPLHALAPSVILGQTWWDEQRNIAYEASDFHCMACGLPKSMTYKNRLEAHEAYDINYEQSEVRLKEVVALCNPCHNYIHVGRLIKQHRDSIISRAYVIKVLSHGIDVLKKADLKPKATQAIHWLILAKGYTKERATEYVQNAGLEVDKFDYATWDNWSIIIDGKRYNGLKFSDWEKMFE